MPGHYYEHIGKKKFCNFYRLAAQKTMRLALSLGHLILYWLIAVATITFNEKNMRLLSEGGN